MEYEEKNTLIKKHTSTVTNIKVKLCQFKMQASESALGWLYYWLTVIWQFPYGHLRKSLAIKSTARQSLELFYNEKQAKAMNYLKCNG